MSQKLPLKPELSKTLMHLPEKPGVYRMINDMQKVLYVGKAINLKKRVQSYFRVSNQSSKTQSMVSQVAAIDVTTTRSEIEALLLESQLIKAFKPKYNVLMRDDKSYPYLYLSTKHRYPSLNLSRQKSNPQTPGYYGPYPSVAAVREALNFVQKHFKIRNCSDREFKLRTRPCLQYQMGRCTAPCVDLVSKKSYDLQVKDAHHFLTGKSKQLITMLTKRMTEYADEMAFEKAAQVRDSIQHLRLTQEQQAMSLRAKDSDVIVSSTLHHIGCVQWVSIRHGEVVDTRSFFPKMPSQSMPDHLEFDALIESFFRYYYLDFPTRIPNHIVLQQQWPDAVYWETVLSQLKGQKCDIQVPIRGPKKNWIKFAHDNLRESVAEKLRSQSLLFERFEALSRALQRPNPIQTMVCFDISHSQGEQTVASCVVFDTNGPLKSAYRQFNISGITSGDDYAAMHQAVARYFKQLTVRDAQWPDLLIIDGGKGQVSAALQALGQFEAHSLFTLGIAKGKSRKPGLERLILDASKQEMSLATDDPAFHLLQHIRDEAHRFAITRHRKKRQKASQNSSLLTIPHIGEKRRQALIQYFGGIKALSQASVDAIANVQGIDTALAQLIYNHFHSK